MNVWRGILFFQLSKGCQSSSLVSALRRDSFQMATHANHWCWSRDVQSSALKGSSLMTVWIGSFQLATCSGVGCQSSVLTYGSLMTVCRGSMFFQQVTHSCVGCQSFKLTCESLMNVSRGSLFFRLATHSGVGC
jgi:hypothetical protein